MIKEISHNNKQIALIIKHNYDKFEGINFYTESNASLQMGSFTHKNGAIIKAHTHKPIKREINNTQEVLIIKKGKLRLDLYSKEKEYIESVIIEEGDIVLLVDGGHGLKCLEDAIILEVKQGPYYGVEEKEIFPEIQDNKVVINE